MKQFILPPAGPHFDISVSPTEFGLRSQRDSVRIGNEVGESEEHRLSIAAAVALMVEGGLGLAYPLVVERIYGDYEFGGNQSTPGIMQQIFYDTAGKRDAAIAMAKPFVALLQDELGDETIVWECPQTPRLVPMDEILTTGDFDIECLKELAEGSGDSWSEIKFEIAEKEAAKGSTQ